MSASTVRPAVEAVADRFEFDAAADFLFNHFWNCNPAVFAEVQRPDQGSGFNVFTANGESMPIACQDDEDHELQVRFPDRLYSVDGSKDAVEAVAEVFRSYAAGLLKTAEQMLEAEREYKIRRAVNVPLPKLKPHALAEPDRRFAGRSGRRARLDGRVRPGVFVLTTHPRGIPCRRSR